MRLVPNRGLRAPPRSGSVGKSPGGHRPGEVMTAVSRTSDPRRPGPGGGTARGGARRVRRAGGLAGRPGQQVEVRRVAQQRDAGHDGHGHGVGRFAGAGEASAGHGGEGDGEQAQRRGGDDGGAAGPDGLDEPGYSAEPEQVAEYRESAEYDHDGGAG